MNHFDVTQFGTTSSAIQRLIDACPDGATLAFRPGEYAVSLTVPNNKSISMVGNGATLTPLPDNSHILDMGSDVRRSVPSLVDGFRIRGHGKQSGLVVRNRTNVKLSRLSVLGCLVGLELYGMSIHTDSCVALENETGVLMTQTEKAGGGNANLFSNCEVRTNQVGYHFDGTQSRYPLENNVIQGGAIQDNYRCGIHAVDMQNLLIVGTHFEANARSGDGCNINAVRSVVRLQGYSPGATSPNIISEGSTIEINGSAAYGTDGDYVLDRGGSRVVMSGYCKLRGTIGGDVRLIGAIVDVDRRLAYARQIPLRWYTTAKLENAVGCDVRGNDVRFAAKPGTTQDNRVTISPRLDSITLGEKLSVSVCMRADKPTRIMLELTDGNYAAMAVRVSEQWQMVTLQAVAESTVEPQLYAYPLDNAGANVEFANFVTNRGQFAHG